MLNEQNTIVIDKKMNSNVWVQYTTQLFDNNRLDTYSITAAQEAPEITLSQVKHAIDWIYTTTATNVNFV